MNKSNIALGSLGFLGSLAFVGFVGLLIHGPIGSHLVMYPSPVDIAASAPWVGGASVQNEPGLWTSGGILLKGTPTLDPAPAGQVQDFTILSSTCQGGQTIYPNQNCQTWIGYNPVPNGITKTLLRVTQGDGTVLTDSVYAITMRVPKGFPPPVFPNP